MNTPEISMGEVGFVILMLGGLVIGIIYAVEDITTWIATNQETLEAIQMATATAEALLYTPTPMPLTTPTPTNQELQATITSLVNQIQP